MYWCDPQIGLLQYIPAHTGAVPNHQASCLSISSPKRKMIHESQSSQSTGWCRMQKLYGKWPCTRNDTNSLKTSEQQLLWIHTCLFEIIPVIGKSHIKHFTWCGIGCKIPRDIIWRTITTHTFPELLQCLSLLWTSVCKGLVNSSGQLLHY